MSRFTIPRRPWLNFFFTSAALALSAMWSGAAADEQWVVYNGEAGVGRGKHIVLVSGDEEYRSEESLTQLGRILAKHHGFAPPPTPAPEAQ